MSNVRITDDNSSGLTVNLELSLASAHVEVMTVREVLQLLDGLVERHLARMRAAVVAL